VVQEEDITAMWSQLEPTPPHITYLTLSVFLIVYALFSQLIKNKLHLSEPPLAVLWGILLGPYALNIIAPYQWGLNDRIMQEITRVIVGIQCFTVGIELPKFYFARHWKSILFLLGPIMVISWTITALFASLIFQIGIPASLIIGACLAPTDPLLAASVLSKSRFSEQVPRRLRHLLFAESACNDGVSFPFLYIGLISLNFFKVGEGFKQWLLITVLWQCCLGLLMGLVIGQCANKLLRYSNGRRYISQPSFLVFYLLLAVLSIGIGSTLGSNDFLIAFGAGVGFAHDGWFSMKTKSVPLPTIVEITLNCSMFVLFGTLIPWKSFLPGEVTPTCSIWRLFLFLSLVLVFRRIPIMYALQRIIPDIRTPHEALFCGHFGPMGVSALFLAIEARAQLETGTSIPLPKPENPVPPYNDKVIVLNLVWPVICFVVLGSTMVHGLSVLALSLGSHLSRPSGERASLIGAETDARGTMGHEGDEGESEPEVSGTEEIIE
jgi:NhaP-type Na+/H+ or K+/H+ antiporter